MKRVANLLALEELGVIAVVRGKDKEQAIKSSEAIIKGGIKGIEVTFTVPKAEEVVRELAEKYIDDRSVIIGAGTVLDAVTARIAILAGAQFIVSPTFDLATAEICNLFQVPYLPGCMTITEMKDALKAGVDIIKLFPANTFEPKVVKAFKAPLPQLNIMPTGGINLTNMKDWFDAGVVAVGVGGNLLVPADHGDYHQVELNAKEYADCYQSIVESRK
ncbi:2-dehydro-3-deoxyphosphogluconate aldolase / (4S)-4-hydroxy-2-oxoglutarate aldolase [Granulicatella balaenopterae]|uniref:2-dehydro-3-deoxyphosphogluconate aldolase / (4S)-4-hydroxy-2-oxoglutarate aldolase n=1 Tax=Granulicatella balaenopterae TaxID=137733 RepID=A0A1H9LW28_9LACT|nr:bifunctional 2-keto-4-hydroxyglutarate aldolase/2-keto-3-deoxy-6-phosphogluconate aldolase [Granulicatella balaenopterae]SER15646.1 2-dehydro-3-deoxyphosphogluconate aldolase / (4S)-4-hydroxy-2-oxoglutarate aldolase [Granulicatella balaenopterae]